MYNSIHIANSCFSHFPIREPKIPRKRFLKYYQDLYALHDKSLSSETFSLGSQYSYTELGNRVLEKYAEYGSLNEIDLFFIVTWSHEFDPDYASVGAYFVDRFNMKCKVFDVIDQGSLAFFTSFSIIQKNLKKNQIQKTLILVMEQTSIPRNKKSRVRLPIHDSAFSLMICNDENTLSHPSHYQILSAGILNNIQIKCFQEIVRECCDVDFSNDKVVNLIYKQNGMIHQKYRQEKIAIPSIKTRAIPNYPGNFSLFFYLNKVTKNRGNSDYTLIFDEDIETKNVGYLLLILNH